MEQPNSTNSQPGTINRRYIGTKVIQAWAMTLGEYNAYRGWQPPVGEAQAAPGYLVEYLDGGKNNDQRHIGYISWSPKEQFDNAYRERPLVPGLAPHQQRVVDERTDLVERLTKLNEFFETPIFATVQADEQHRMRTQAVAMRTLSEILGERIAAF